MISAMILVIMLMKVLTRVRVQLHLTADDQWLVFISETNVGHCRKLTNFRGTCKIVNLCLFQITALQMRIRRQSLQTIIRQCRTHGEMVQALKCVSLYTQ